MNLEHGIAVAMCILVATVVTLILADSGESPYWGYLQKIKQQEFEDGCDASCKKFQESRYQYICVPLGSEEYVCRPPRTVFYPDDDVQVRTAFPPTYGEFAYIPEGHEVMRKNRIFDITTVVVSDLESKEILVEFGHHVRKETENHFEHSSVLYPGDTFVSHCFGGDSRMGHMVEYRDIIKIEGQMYVEFWGTHVDMPDELLPCQMPELIEQSLLADMELGVDFGENEN